MQAVHFSSCAIKLLLFYENKFVSADSTDCNAWWGGAGQSFGGASSTLGSMGFPSTWAGVSIPSLHPCPEPPLGFCNEQVRLLHIAVLASHRRGNNTQKVHKLLTAKIKTLFSTWKRQGVMAMSYSWGIFLLDTRGTFFTMSTISLWNNLHREMVDSATSDTSKIHLGHFFQVMFCQEWLDQMILEVPYSMILPLKVAEAGRLHSTQNTWPWCLLWFSFAKHGNFGLGGKTDFHSQGWHFSLLCSNVFQGWAKHIGGKSGLTSPCIICS